MKALLYPESMKIAWTLAGQKQIFIGELAYTDGQVKIINKKLLIDNADGRVMVDGQEYETIIETQNWRPALEEELIYSEYRMGGYII